MDDNTQSQSTASQNNKRIAKNTLMLYFRQILIMLVSLYTVRVVLNVLGAEDYGIYNVVAGVVVLFSFVNNAMASGTQRFLNFYIGKNDEEKTNAVYSSSLVIYLFIVILFVLLAETIGLWFVNYKLNIPVSRHSATLIVYQFTVLTTVFSIFRVPYNAVIIAYERMNFFAFLSIFEAISKLAVVFFLIHSTFDKLVNYAFLLAIVSFFITVIYKIYCNNIFPIAHFKKVDNLSFFKEQLSFNGWSLFGAVANVCNTQGTNVLINMFTNVTVNAAMGIANQVSGAVYSFLSSFQTAFQPQIIKSYAEKNEKYFKELLFETSKASFFLVTYIVVPLMLNAEPVLHVWLKVVPDYSVHFVQLILVWLLIESLTAPLAVSIQATGKIQKYQIIVSIFIFLNLPLSYVALLCKASPSSVLVIRIVILWITAVWRVLFLSKILGFSSREYFFNIIFRCFSVAILSFFVTSLICYCIKNQILYFFSTCLLSVIFTTFLILFLGFNSMERGKIFFILKQRARNNKK